MLVDFAGPWEEPLSFAGFGTPFQREIAKFPDILEANDAVDAALARWAATVDRNAVLEILAEIITNRPGPDFYNNFIERRPAAWENAIEQVMDVLHNVDPK